MKNAPVESIFTEKLFDAASFSSAVVEVGTLSSISGRVKLIVIIKKITSMKITSISDVKSTCKSSSSKSCIFSLP